MTLTIRVQVVQIASKSLQIFLTFCDVAHFFSIDLSCIILESIPDFFLDLNTNSAIVQLYHGEKKLIFNEMKKRSALY